MPGLLPTNAPKTRLGSVRAAVLDRVAAVRSPRFWRVLYWLLARRATVRAVAAALRATDSLRPGIAARALVRSSQLLVQSGWPNQSPAWVNLDTSRFVARTTHVLTPRRRATPKQPREDLGGVVRLGVLGRLGRPLVFWHEHFRALPAGIELHVFDVEHDGRLARYLEGTAHAYTALPSIAGDPAAVGTAAEAVNAADLDALAFLSGPGDAYELIDALETPCIGFVTITSNLLFHERVGFQIYCQPQADYFFHHGELFCGLSRAPFREPGVKDGFLLLGARSFLPERERRPWSEREPLLVYHGALYKAYSPTYLDTVFEVLREDDSLQFVLMGRDDDGALAEITALARTRGVAGQVSYEGEFSLATTPDGDAVADAGWERLVDLLDRARLVPDPWPICGARSRVEAYAMRVPTAHMRVRFDRAAWGRRQHQSMEMPRLLVPEASATTRSGYADVCRRCLHDGAFAERIADAQEAAAASVMDAAAWWEQLRAGYLAWRGRS